MSRPSKCLRCGQAVKYFAAKLCKRCSGIAVGLRIGAALAKRSKDQVALRNWLLGDKSQPADATNTPCGSGRTARGVFLGRGGFSITEMLMVAAMIATLSTMALGPNLRRVHIVEAQRVAQVNMAAILTSLQAYRGYAGHYPQGTQWKVEMYGNDCEYLPGHWGPRGFCIAGNGNTASDVVGGYAWTMRGEAVVESPTYQVMARPRQWKKDGIEVFFGDDTGLMTHCEMTTATVPAIAQGPNWQTVDKPAGPC